ncbi:MAG: NrfD/PsrC family molybdoenzyme membrane anchor subunit [Thermoanaerobaculales bacterium]
MSAVAASSRRIQAMVQATLGRPGWGHLLLIVLAAGAASLGGWCFSVQIHEGMSVWGLNRPVGWATEITNFVFWVGIAHSGTLISAVLFLLRARFRTAIYRVAEAMTVFGVMTAGTFPVIHLGRPWFFYWLFPYPNERHLWVNFRSPLMWDVFAVSTYFIVSTIFLVVGIVPDAAALRDASHGWRRRFYGFFAAGWRGTDEEWRHYARAYLYFAAFATPLVFSVHSVVSWDFAVSILPGWHSTIFPPYFVAGAIFSGIAMVVTLLVPLRKALHLEELITPWHFDMTSRVLILTSLIVTYSYILEFALALHGGASPERSTLLYRATGTFAPLFWTMVACNCVFPLLLFLRRVRTTPASLLVICLLINVGMWLERFVIIVTSLSHDQNPADWWGAYRPTLIEAGITFGAFGWFFFWFLIFIKLLPAVSISEMKEAAVHEVAHA